MNAYSGGDDGNPTTSETVSDSPLIQSDSQTKEKDIKFTVSTKSSDKDLKVSYSKLQQASDISLLTEVEDETEPADTIDDETYEGLIMSSSVARNPVDYVRFMANYQVNYSLKPVDHTMLNFANYF